MSFFFSPPHFQSIYNSRYVHLRFFSLYDTHQKQKMSSHYFFSFNNLANICLCVCARWQSYSLFFFFFSFPQVIPVIPIKTTKRCSVTSIIITLFFSLLHFFFFSLDTWCSSSSINYISNFVMEVDRYSILIIALIYNKKFFNVVFQSQFFCLDFIRDRNYG